MDLLGACRPVSDHPAERRFIRAHQRIELGFADVLDSIDTAMAHLMVGEWKAVVAALRRCHSHTLQTIDELLTVPQLVTPREFMQFRSSLGHASGLQSTQFRLIEFVSGHKDERWLHLVHISTENRDRLAARFAAPALWDEFLGAAEIDPAQPAGRRIFQLTEVFAQPGPLTDVAEELRRHDLLWKRWRQSHAGMVETMLGRDVVGTGGTDGVGWLESRASVCWYADLHAAHYRASVGEGG